MADRRTETFAEGRWTITVTAETVQEYWVTPVGATARHEDGRVERIGVASANFESWEAAFAAGREAMKVGLT